MKSTYIKLAFWSIIFFVLSACQSENEQAQTSSEQALQQMTWEEIEAQAKGSTVNMMMWMGDPLINAYMNNFVKPKLKEKYGINLEITEGQGKQIVSVLIGEIEAGKAQSALDMIWFNGETFFQLKQLNALYGPFTDRLPNAQLINFDNPFISIDFQQKIEGMECPWGNVQLLLIHNQEKVPSPPKSLEELEKFVKENPGKFTIGTEFTGITLLKSMLVALADSPEDLYGPFDEAKYEKYSTQLWEYLNRVKPYFWKEGKTFPATLAPMHQMFANGELYFTMSNNDAEVDNKINQGLFPETARAFPLESGTIQNSHYLGIVKKAKNKAGALVTINYMISPEAQFEKFQPKVWGDGTVLDIDKLPEEWQEKFKNAPGRNFAPRRAEIQPFAIQELAPEYMIRLYEDFRSQVIEK